MKKIKLIQDAYIEGYEGAFLEMVSEDGKKSANGLWDYWYTAAAKDENGDLFTVYWRIKDDYDESIQEEDEACDWGEPYMIINVDGNNVTDTIDEIEW